MSDFVTVSEFVQGGYVCHEGGLNIGKPCRERYRITLVPSFPRWTELVIRKAGGAGEGRHE